MLNSEVAMPVTAKDVARELNLSQPTVSRILNGDARHRAAEETRQRVWETAKRLGYQPNAVARSLRHGKTNVIGVHTSHNYDVRNDFLRVLVGALQCACGDYDLDLMLHNVAHGSRAEVMYGKLRDGRIDGLILHGNDQDPLIEVLRESALPVVAVANPLEGLHCVTSDDSAGMVQLIEVLWERGHRKFVFVAPQVELPSVVRRQLAFESELERRGVAAANRRVIAIDFEQAWPIVDELRADAPLAVCCWNDRTAYNLLSACGERGIDVPGQLAVTGFDGFLDDKLPALQLVTVKCPWEDVAAVALQKLVELVGLRLKKKERPVPQEICLPVQVTGGNTI